MLSCFKVPKNIRLNSMNFFILRVEHISLDTEKFTGNRNTKTNIYRIYVYYSIMWGYFCIGFVDFMFQGKSLTEFFHQTTLKVMTK